MNQRTNYDKIMMKIFDTSGIPDNTGHREMLGWMNQVPQVVEGFCCSKYDIDRFSATQDGSGQSYANTAYGGGTMGGFRLNRPYSFERSMQDEIRLKESYRHM